jgi:hypothetical protein
VTVNLEVVAVVPAVVTRIAPVAARAGTVVLMFVAELTLQVADVVLNLIEHGEVNPVPRIATAVPTPLEAGVNDATVGTISTISGLVALADPAVTLTRPDVAFAGTVTLILVAESPLKRAVAPWMDTLVTLNKPVPVITSVAPALARDGATEVIDTREAADAVAGPAARRPPAIVTKAASVMATDPIDFGLISRMTFHSIVVIPRLFVDNMESLTEGVRAPGATPSDTRGVSETGSRDLSGLSGATREQWSGAGADLRRRGRGTPSRARRSLLLDLQVGN